MKKALPFVVIMGTILLLVLVIFWDKLETEKEKVQGRRDKVILGCKPEQVGRISMANRYLKPGVAKAIELEKKDGLWQSAGNLERVRLDSEKVDSFLKTICSYSYQKKIIKEEAFAEFGLDNPLILVELANAKSSWRIALGGKTPVGFGLYVQGGGTGAAYGTYIGSQFILLAANKDLSDFVSKNE
jgi:hypothetical protein